MKTPLQSLTIWGILIAAISNFLPQFGYQVDEQAANDFLNAVLKAYPEIVEAIGLLLAIIGRWRANAPIKPLLKK